jgi:hypothetical protein
MMVCSAGQKHIFDVFRRLAPARAAELTATAWHDDPEKLARDLVVVQESLAYDGHAPHLFALLDDVYQPFAIVGVVQLGPGLGAMIWAEAGAAAAALPGHRWWRTYFVPCVMERHYRRIEFTALADNAEDRRWLKILGFTEEGIAYRQGKRGEDFIHFAWLNPDPTVGVHV